MGTSRRKFIKSSALFTLFTLGTTKSFSKETKKSQRFDEVFDVVVVGSGISGTIAAIRSAERGARTLLIEKMGRLGGTSRISGLNFACVGSPAQQEKGIKDTPEKLANDMYKVSGGLGDYELALQMAKNTSLAEKFLRERGVQWDGRLAKLGGHSEPRVLFAKGDGAGMLTALWRHMESLKNLTVRTHVKADELILNSSGEVSGIKVRNNYLFDETLNDEAKNVSGDAESVGIRQALIFATGGYSRDKKFRAIEVPFLAGVATTTNPGATADALKILVRAGAQPVHLSLFRFAYPLPTEDMVWGVLIDPATSKRFINEGESRNTLATSVLVLRTRNGDKKPFMVYDETALSKFHNTNRIQRSLNGLNGIDGTMYSFNSLDKLAKFYGADAETLKASLEKYNEMIKNKHDDDFGKPLERSGRNIEPLNLNGTLYGIVVNPRLNYTPGGIKTDKKARALRLADGEPIPRLYVIGEAAGGLHGQERMTACSMPDCATSAITAADHATSLPKLKGENHE